MVKIMPVVTCLPSPLERIYKEKNKENDDENENEDDGKNYADGKLPPLSPWKNI